MKTKDNQTLIILVTFLIDNFSNFPPQRWAVKHLSEMRYRMVITFLK